MYKDGRFAADKAFCFYGLNYLQRKKNLDQGAYYVKDFNKETPQTLQQLQELVNEGNTQWIDKIMYFGGTIRGSSAFWRQR